MANANNSLVYIGPTIPGVPPALEDAIRENPMLRQLLVTPSARPDAQAQISQQSGRFYSIYKAVQTKLGQKGVK